MNAAVVKYKHPSDIRVEEMSWFSKVQLNMRLEACFQVKLGTVVGIHLKVLLQIVQYDDRKINILCQ